MEWVLRKFVMDAIETDHRENIKQTKKHQNV